MIFWVFIDGINPLSCKMLILALCFNWLKCYFCVYECWDTNRAVWSSSRCSYWHTHREWLSLHCMLWINTVTGRQKWNKSCCVTIHRLWAFWVSIFHIFDLCSCDDFSSNTLFSVSVLNHLRLSLYWWSCISVDQGAFQHIDYANGDRWNWFMSWKDFPQRSEMWLEPL